MDSKEHIEIQEAIRKGRPETDEGPYYHESWWEAYKGSVKGKLGGAGIGTIVGTIIGVGTALALMPFVGGAALGAVIAGFAAGGMLYGAHEFGEIGKNVGANAAIAETQEKRMTAFENGKFAEIKKEIGDLKALITGEKPSTAAASKSTPATAKDFPTAHSTKHCDEHCPPQEQKWVFWKIATIGLVIGLAAGALLAAGGFTSVLEHALGETGKTLLSGAGKYIASMTTLGLFGASFGINRDMFRQVFDKTDLLFKGITQSQSRAPQIQMARAPEQPVTTVMYEAPITYPESGTHHRDKVLAAAREALLRMDHTKITPH